MFGKPKNSPNGNKEADDIGADVPSVEDVELPQEAPKAQPVKRDSPISSVLASQKPSVISEGFCITGDIQSNGILHVEGRISGTVAAQSVNISAKGEVEGEIRCNSLNIKGSFQGMADCDELVVASSAHVNGKILYRYITIGSGAQVQGELSVKA